MKLAALGSGERSEVSSEAEELAGQQFGPWPELAEPGPPRSISSPQGSRSGSWGSEC